MFLISTAALKQNTAILREIADAAGCKVVLALKGFSCWKAFPHIAPDLDGCCASGLWEAQLAQEHFKKHIITYSPAYDDADIEALLTFTHHLDFNSLTQWFRFREKIFAHPRFISGELQCGLRINPEHSTGTTPEVQLINLEPGIAVPGTKNAAQAMAHPAVHYARTTARFACI